MNLSVCSLVNHLVLEDHGEGNPRLHCLGGVISHKDVSLAGQPRKRLRHCRSIFRVTPLLLSGSFQDTCQPDDYVSTGLGILCKYLLTYPANAYMHERCLKKVSVQVQGNGPARSGKNLILIGGSEESEESGEDGIAGLQGGMCVRVI